MSQYSQLINSNLAQKRGPAYSHPCTRLEPGTGLTDTVIEMYLYAVIRCYLQSVYYHILKLPRSFILNEFSYHISQQALLQVNPYLFNNSMQIFYYISMKCVKNYYLGLALEWGGNCLDGREGDVPLNLLRAEAVLDPPFPHLAAPCHSQSQPPEDP